MPVEGLSATIHVQAVFSEFTDVRIAFGVSDEYSFVLHKHSRLFGEARAELQAAYLRMPGGNRAPCFSKVCTHRLAHTAHSVHRAGLTAYDK